MRGLAIIAVGVIHSCGFAWNPKENPDVLIPYLVTRQIFGFAVPLFVFLSGYLLGRHDFGGWADYTRFLRKRILRLIPPYLFWSLVAVGIDTAHGKPWDRMELTHALLYGRVMVPLYFVPMIMQLYLSLPVWTWLNRWRWLSIAAALLISGWLWGYYWRVSAPWWYMVMAGSWLVYFVLGVMWRRQGVPQFHWSRQLSLLGTVAAVLISSVISLHCWHHGMFVLSTSSLRWDSALYSFCLIWWLMQHKEWLETAPRWLVWLGRNSFFAYLSHAFVLHRLGQMSQSFGWVGQWPYLKIAVFVILCLGIPAVIGWAIAKPNPHGLFCRLTGAGS